jgi:chromosome segregation ATPase
VPWAYGRVIEPVQDGLVRIAKLEIRLDESNARWEERVSTLEEQLDGLESDVDSQADRVAVLEDTVGQVNEAQAGLEAGLAAHRQVLDDLSASLAALVEDKADAAQLEDLEGEVRDEITELQDQVSSAERVVEQVDALGYGLALLETRGELVKAYLDLTEGNAGDAETTLALALTHLAQATELAPEGDQEVLAAVEADLARTGDRLRDEPVLAAQALRSAWAELGALVP